MKKAALIAATLIAVLALSVGAYALPAVGVHPFSLVLPATPTTVNPPAGRGNSTGNETSANRTGAPAAPPAANASAMGNISVEHNVTVVRAANATWINGTIVVDKGNVTLASITFEIVTYHNGTVSVTINETRTAGSLTITVRGQASFVSATQTLVVFGTATGIQNGLVQWEQTFGFGFIPGHPGSP